MLWIEVFAVAVRADLQRRAQGTTSSSRGYLSRPPTAPARTPRLGRIGDGAEREAERAADAVAGGGLAPALSRDSGTVRRLGTDSASGSPQAAAAGLSGAGAPLSAGLRDYFEPRFQRDFSDVRVHTGSEAARGARAIGARAYTLGSRIAFSEGAFEPATSAGRRLIAHELAHVAQQEGEAEPCLRRDPLTVEQIRAQLAELEFRAAEQVSIPPEEMAAMQAERQSLLAQLREGMSVRTAAPPPAPGAAPGAPAAPRSPAAVGETLSMPPVEPEAMVEQVVTQRSFGAARPTPEGGTAPIPDAALAPGVRGRALGSGFETNAAIQIIDADGNQVAYEMARYGGSGEPHAEAQAVARLRLRAAGRSVRGGRMVVAVDQIACGGCLARLRALAVEMGLTGFEVWTPGPAEGSKAGPKWTSRTATTRPARGPGSSGGTGLRMRPVLSQAESIAPPAPAPAAPTAVEPSVSAPRPAVVEPAAPVAPRPVVAEPAAPVAPAAEPAAPRPLPVEPAAPIAPAAEPAAPRPLPVEPAAPVAPEGAAPGAPRRGGGSGTGGALFGLGLQLFAGWIHGGAVRERMRRQTDESGYAPTTGPSGEGLLYDIGSWLIDPFRDAERSVPIQDRLNVPAWRAEVRRRMGAVPAGGSFTMNWEMGLCSEDLFGRQEMEVRPVTYRREADGHWTVTEGDTTGTIDINRVLSTDVPDDVISAEIYTDPCPSIQA